MFVSYQYLALCVCEYLCNDNKQTKPEWLTFLFFFLVNRPTGNKENQNKRNEMKRIKKKMEIKIYLSQNQAGELCRRFGRTIRSRRARVSLPISRPISNTHANMKWETNPIRLDWLQCVCVCV